MKFSTIYKEDVVNQITPKKKMTNALHFLVAYRHKIEFISKPLEERLFQVGIFFKRRRHTKTFTFIGVSHHHLIPIRASIRRCLSIFDLANPTKYNPVPSRDQLHLSAEEESKTEDNKVQKLAHCSTYTRPLGLPLKEMFHPSCCIFKETVNYLSTTREYNLWKVNFNAPLPIYLSSQKEVVNSITLLQKDKSSRPLDLKESKVLMIET